MAKYIYQHEEWTDFTWNERQISVLLAQVRHLQGRLMGKMTSLGFGYQEEATLENITLDILKSSEIEGEKLNRAQIRSSVARRLGLNVAGLVNSARNIDGIVEMMLDATQRHELPLTEERMFGWHAALFPMGYSGACKIDVACYRKGAMQRKSQSNILYSKLFGRRISIFSEYPVIALFSKGINSSFSGESIPCLPSLSAIIYLSLHVKYKLL
jgi:Fic family protein